MTLQRFDNHSTEFGLWLRKQSEIDSKLGYLATNVDYCWKNYKTCEWMFIEEKRHNAEVKQWQRKMFHIINKVCKGDKNYKGFHLLVFENTSPEDGKIYLNNKEITKDELINFLMFK